MRGSGAACAADLGRPTERQASLEAELARLGHALERLCLPDGVGEALASLIDGCPVGTMVEICFEADDPEIPRACRSRQCACPTGECSRRSRPWWSCGGRCGLNAAPQPALAGPLKSWWRSARPTRAYRQRRARPRAGAAEHPRRGRAGAAAGELARCASSRSAIPRSSATRSSATPTTCCTSPATACPARWSSRTRRDGAVARTAASVAGADPPAPDGRCRWCCSTPATAACRRCRRRAWRRRCSAAGVPAVRRHADARSATSMPPACAQSFYEHLARRETLAGEPRARRCPQGARAPAPQTQWSAAAAWSRRSRNTRPPALYVAGDGAAARGLRRSTSSRCARARCIDVPGPVPQLRLDDLIGRRRELRETLRHAARDRGTSTPASSSPASAASARVRLPGRVDATSHRGRLAGRRARGRFDLAAVGGDAGCRRCSLRAARPIARLGELAGRGPISDDRVRQDCSARRWRKNRILLVLDDFEHNLADGRRRLPRRGGGGHLRFMAAKRPQQPPPVHVPPSGPGNRRAGSAASRVGPLTLADTRKLLLRLPGLSAAEASETAHDHAADRRPPAHARVSRRAAARRQGPPAGSSRTSSGRIAQWPEARPGMRCPRDCGGHSGRADRSARATSCSQTCSTSPGARASRGSCCRPRCRTCR